ncbi:MAG TPA: hypothetical protein VF669_10070 [Tepidisphaeraceae bacterium]|jgi:hypothetical protein
MRRGVLFPAVLAGLGAAAASAEPVNFQLVSQSVQVDQSAKTATFTLTFNRAPDFSLVSAINQYNTFQYEIDATVPSNNDATTIGINEIDAVIRGGEVAQGPGLPIRSTTGNGGPTAGGWGPIVDVVPYNLNFNTVTFTTPLASIGDTDGVFRYRVFTTDHGSVTSDASAVIPLPAALGTGIALMGGLSFARRLNRRR